MAKKEILVGYGVDIDAVAGWLGSPRAIPLKPSQSR